MILLHALITYASLFESVFRNDLILSTIYPNEERYQELIDKIMHYELESPPLTRLRDGTLYYKCSFCKQITTYHGDLIQYHGLNCPVCYIIKNLDLPYNCIYKEKPSMWNPLYQITAKNE